MKQVTQTDVARAAGISQRAVASVVGRVGTEGTRVSEETRQRILAAAKKLGYRPQRQAQLLRGVKSGMIGVIKNVTLHQSIVEIAYHVSLTIHQAGYSLLTQEHWWSTSDEVKGTMDILRDARVEGVLLVGSHINPASLRQAGIPVVSLEGARWRGVPCVAADHGQGMRDLTKHLLSLGYRRLAYECSLGPHEKRTAANWAAHERLANFLATCREAGLGDGDIRVIWQPARDGNFDHLELGRQTARTLLETQDNLPDVLVCANDSRAIGAHKYLLDQGVDVPGRMALTGFSDTAAGRHFTVPLTTMALPTARIANLAAEQLVSLIRKTRAPASIPKCTLLPCELVVRESCGAGLQAGLRHPHPLDAPQNSLPQDHE